MVLVDIENLCGTAWFSGEQARLVRMQVERISGLPPDSQVVVATSSGDGLVEAGLAWPGSRLVWIPGRDGAELALADVALNEDVAGRFARVVICSGDGLLAVAARYLKLAGVDVTIVAGADRLSRILAATSDDVRLLPRGLGRVA